eukprot:6297091-Prymnesium_polylepis.1
MSGQTLIGQRVAIFWGGDACWYEGTASAYDPTTDLITVAYDDGETMLHSFAGAQWKLREQAAAASTAGNLPSASGGAVPS